MSIDIQKVMKPNPHRVGNLALRIVEAKKNKFDAICKERKLTMSKCVERFIDAVIDEYEKGKLKSA